MILVRVLGSWKEYHDAIWRKITSKMEMSALLLRVGHRISISGLYMFTEARIPCDVNCWNLLLLKLLLRGWSWSFNRISGIGRRSWQAFKAFCELFLYFHFLKMLTFCLFEFWGLKMSSWCVLWIYLMGLFLNNRSRTTHFMGLGIRVGLANSTTIRALL